MFLSRFSYFQDPRFRQERIMLVIGLPLCFILLATVLVVTLYLPQRQSRGNTEMFRQATEPLPRETAKEKPAQTDTPDELYNRLAEVRSTFLAGNLDAARAQLAEVNLDQAGLPLGWEMAGLLKESEGDTEAAMELYSKGISITPSEKLFYRRALLHRANGDLEAARKDLDQAASFSPSNTLVSNERLLLLIQMGQKEQARGEISSLGSLNGDTNTAGCIFALCGMALENGDYFQARDLLGRGKTLVDADTFEQILKNPVISRCLTRPEIMPFYFSNISAQ